LQKFLLHLLLHGDPGSTCHFTELVDKFPEGSIEILAGQFRIQLTLAHTADAFEKIPEAPAAVAHQHHICQ
jgi:hypothetical protein